MQFLFNIYVCFNVDILFDLLQSKWNLKFCRKNCAKKKINGSFFSSIFNFGMLAFKKKISRHEFIPEFVINYYKINMAQNN